MKLTYQLPSVFRRPFSPIWYKVFHDDFAGSQSQRRICAFADLPSLRPYPSACLAFATEHPVACLDQDLGSAEPLGPATLYCRLVGPDLSCQAF